MEVNIEPAMGGREAGGVRGAAVREGVATDMFMVGGVLEKDPRVTGAVGGGTLYGKEGGYVQFWEEDLPA